MTTEVPAQVEDDLGAFAERHRAKLLRLALGLCRDPDAAEDLVQDTLLRLVTRWPMVRSARSPWAYVRQTMVRVFLSRPNPHHRSLPLIDDVVDHRDAFGEVDELDAAVRRLHQLAPRARAVLTLRYIECLDDAAIADALGTSRVAVRVTAHRALRVLKIDEGT
ncbi:RNA polymerase sigma factor [Cellulomonas uda]|uniref:RNA polymerase sigma factor n=1 Tax=Cellulomonas uda TaxID=1714 RepID=UPI00141AFB6B|nr:sigma-70 family RNA polymerase sigma factor [Cellulomonas uda]NII65871.1 RNA polymerase sigma factor (sigma-70 family) [Cellulomonas uda]